MHTPIYLLIYRYDSGTFSDNTKSSLSLALVLAKGSNAKDETLMAYPNRFKPTCLDCQGDESCVQP